MKNAFLLWASKKVNFVRGLMWFVSGLGFGISSLVVGVIFLIVAFGLSFFACRLEVMADSYRLVNADKLAQANSYGVLIESALNDIMGNKSNPPE